MLYYGDHSRDIYYDNKNVLKCPKCNNLIFYVQYDFFDNDYKHECPIENKTYKIYEDEIRNKSNELFLFLNIS